MPRGAGRGRPRDDTREQAILDAALDLLIEVGYERMSMVAVAARARASKATIYRRWSCKDEMVVDALKRAGPADRIPPDTGSLREDLVSEVRLMVETISGPNGALLVGVLRAASESPRLASVIQANVMQHKSEVSRCLFNRAVSRGEISSSEKSDVAMELTMAMIFSRLLVTGEPLDETFVAHMVDDVLIPLLSAPPCSNT